MRSKRIDHVRNDFQTAEILTADCADNADKDRRISDHPRHLRYPRLNVLADPSLVAALSHGAKDAG
jgi:hypothetical protein